MGQCICPANSVLNAQGSACVCDAGFEGDLNTPGGQCTPCPVAKYKVRQCRLLNLSPKPKTLNPKPKTLKPYQTHVESARNY